MITTNQIARVAGLIGEPARTAMLTALMGGQALTASELARCARVSPATASGHLSQLATEGLLKLERQGRHRYYRLATPEVARLIENVMQLASSLARAGSESVPVVFTGPRDAAMRHARTCYDHFAGRLGVGIADAMLATGLIEFSAESGSVSARGIEHLARFGIEIAPGRPTAGAVPVRVAKRSRPLCRPCLDWSERRPHVAGAVGAAICAHFMDSGWVRRIGATRALEVTPPGAKALYELFGIRDLG